MWRFRNRWQTLKPTEEARVIVVYCNSRQRTNDSNALSVISCFSLSPFGRGPWDRRLEIFNPPKKSRHGDGIECQRRKGVVAVTTTAAAANGGRDLIADDEKKQRVLFTVPQL
jgi:hypothetical protein